MANFSTGDKRKCLNKHHVMKA